MYMGIGLISYWRTFFVIWSESKQFRFITMKKILEIQIRLQIHAIRSGSTLVTQVIIGISKKWRVKNVFWSIFVKNLCSTSRDFGIPNYVDCNFHLWFPVPTLKLVIHSDISVLFGIIMITWCIFSLAFLLM